MLLLEINFDSAPDSTPRIAAPSVPVRMWHGALMLQDLVAVVERLTDRWEATQWTMRIETPTI